MIPDRYASASDLTPDALRRIWRRIPAECQEAIGIKLLTNLLAELVADDDGLISTEAERDAACRQSQDSFQELYDIAQAALPQVLWHYPEGYRYELRDSAGAILKVFDDFDAVPQALRDAAAIKGWCGAVLPDGRRYPDEFLPVDDGVKLPGTPRRRPHAAPITGGQFSSQV